MHFLSLFFDQFTDKISDIFTQNFNLKCPRTFMTFQDNYSKGVRSR